MYQKLFELQEELLEGLANHKRLEILQLLGNGELTVNQMVRMLGLAQANLSQHLSVLRGLKLVATRRKGQHVYYRLSNQQIGKLLAQLRNFISHQYAHEPEVAKIKGLNHRATYPIVTDLVCGMRIATSEAVESVLHDGQVYYFCGVGCERRFRARPARYVQASLIKAK